jgi:glutamate--cysteine ligase
VIRPAERPLHALRQRGVEYVEVRAMDLDPFEPIGIASSTARFLDIFLLYCLITESPPDSPHEIETMGRNKQAVAARGREAGLLLERGGEKVALRDWAAEVLAVCEPIAGALDRAYRTTDYSAALAAAFQTIDRPELLASARVLAEMRDKHDNSYAKFGLAISLAHRETLRREPLPAAVVAEYERIAAESLVNQKKIEASDSVPFEIYRQRYLSPAALIPSPDEDPADDQGKVENFVGV